MANQEGVQSPAVTRKAFLVLTAAKRKAQRNASIASMRSGSLHCSARPETPSLRAGDAQV